MSIGTSRPSKFACDSFAHLPPGMGIEQTGASHRSEHLPQPRHGNGQAQHAALHIRPDRRIEKSQESPPAVLTVFVHGTGDGHATPRAEQRHDGLRRIVVEEGPRTQPRQNVRRRQEESPLYPVEGVDPVDAGEMKVFAAAARHIQLLDIFRHRSGRRLVTLLQRDEIGDMPAHRGEPRVEPATSATDRLRIHADDLARSHGRERLEQTPFRSLELPFRHVRIPECNGQFGPTGKRLAIVGYESLDIHVINIIYPVRRRAGDQPFLHAKIGKKRDIRRKIPPIRIEFTNISHPAG